MPDAMTAFDWIAAGFVVVTMVYLSFFLTLREWFAALGGERRSRFFQNERAILFPSGHRSRPCWLAWR
jgi:hypothetical protein